MQETLTQEVIDRFLGITYKFPCPECGKEMDSFSFKCPKCNYCLALTDMSDILDSFYDDFDLLGHFGEADPHGTFYKEYYSLAIEVPSLYAILHIECRLWTLEEIYKVVWQAAKRIIKELFDVVSPYDIVGYLSGDTFYFEVVVNYVSG